MFAKLAQLPKAIQQYLLITLNYWFFTLTDGALRMLVVLYFYQLGYSAIAIAMLFLFYEIFGVVTNLVGGWLGARIGLNRTMNIGLWLQVFALLMLTVPAEYLSVIYVMAAQALSGIAKDLNKMSAKSSIKTLVPAEQQGQLFKWVALLTGSKNALKGLGFFLGGLLLTCFGFQTSLLLLAGVLAVVAVISVMLLEKDLGKAKSKAKFTELFAKDASLNYFSAARLFLFASRDVWFVVALPVYLASQFHWQHGQVGAFLAAWVIFYGVIQALAPKLTGKSKQQTPSAKQMSHWAYGLTLFTVLLVIALGFSDSHWVITIGLLIFAGVFAINSALHSYGIVALAQADGVSLDVGFYYMANALGRLLGTVLSGVVFQLYGMEACLIFAIIFSAIAAILVNKVNLK
ncbi:MAG: organoarsenical effux MFS transporter ArsJ [Thalassotalea sp.]